MNFWCFLFTPVTTFEIWQVFLKLVGPNILASFSLLCLNMACFFSRGSLEERTDTTSAPAEEGLLILACDTLWDLSLTSFGLLWPVACVGSFKGASSEMSAEAGAALPQEAA